MLLENEDFQQVKAKFKTILGDKKRVKSMEVNEVVEKSLLEKDET